MKDVKHIKLWGPLRSGTNYLGRVMELNFPDQIKIHHNEGGWKHGPPQTTYYREMTIAGRKIFYDGDLLIMKNPFAWIDSMRRYPMYSEPPDLVDLAHNWNQHARELFSFSWREDVHLVRYERLLQFFELEMEDIAKIFDLEVPRVWKDEKRKMLRGGDQMKGSEAVSRVPRDNSYYLDREYMNNFSKEAIDLIKTIVDEYLIKQLRYEDEFSQLLF